MRGRAPVTLNTAKQFFHLRMRDLHLPQLGNGLHLARIKLAIRPRALFAKQRCKFSRRVGEFGHKHIFDRPGYFDNSQI